MARNRIWLVIDKYIIICQNSPDFKFNLINSIFKKYMYICFDPVLVSPAPM